MTRLPQAAPAVEVAQEYVVFLRASAGKIAFLREYFDPTRVAKAVNTPILDLDS